MLYSQRVIYAEREREEKQVEPALRYIDRRDARRRHHAA